MVNIYLTAALALIRWGGKDQGLQYLYQALGECNTDKKGARLKPYVMRAISYARRIET